jgi:hypothetical protein
MAFLLVLKKNNYQFYLFELVTIIAHPVWKRETLLIVYLSFLEMKFLWSLNCSESRKEIIHLSATDKPSTMPLDVGNQQCY